MAEYLKKKKLYELTKKLLGDKKIPLMKDCEYKFFQGSERLSFQGVGDDYHYYKVASERGGNWVNIEEKSGMDLIRSDIYSELKDGAYTYHSAHGPGVEAGMEEKINEVPEANSGPTEERFPDEKLVREITAADIRENGFTPTDTLIRNVMEFSKREGRRYSLKELARLKKTNPDFRNSVEKKECFERIVKECQEQELERMKEVPNFLKQEMATEQLQMISAG